MHIYKPSWYACGEFCRNPLNGFNTHTSCLPMVFLPIHRVKRLFWTQGTPKRRFYYNPKFDSLRSPYIVFMCGKESNKNVLHYNWWTKYWHEPDVCKCFSIRSERSEKEVLGMSHPLARLSVWIAKALVLYGTVLSPTLDRMTRELSVLFTADRCKII